MELLGHQLISADRQTVWNALNDPEILVRCIPGCEEIDRLSDNQLRVRLMVKMGPVRSRFAGTLALEDVVPPESCSLVFEGTGAAGFAKGGARVVLTSQSNQTRLEYTAKASVGGKLGQIGGRLIESSARKMADEFFSALQAVLSEGAQADNATAPNLSAADPSAINANSEVSSIAAKRGPAPSDANRAPAEARPETIKPVQSTPSATATYSAAAPPRGDLGAGAGWRPELYRAFWFCLGVFFTLLVGHWLP